MERVWSKDGRRQPSPIDENVEIRETKAEVEREAGQCKLTLGCSNAERWELSATKWSVEDTRLIVSSEKH